MERSKDAIGYITASDTGNRMEVIQSGGIVWWAPMSNVIDCSGPNAGNRSGRFLAYAHAWPIPGFENLDASP